MKILHNTLNNRPYYTPISTAIQRTAKATTRDFNFLVPKGWQLIVKMKSGGETFFHLHLIEGEGGSYAEAKMSTLENFPEMPYTGGDGINDVQYMLEKLNLNDSVYTDKIRAAESPNLFTKELQEWLRDKCGIAVTYGGIRIPYEFLINADKEYTARGEILITFSGASQEQDVFFALWIFKSVQQALSEHQDNIQHSYELGEILRNPTIHHWISIIGVHDCEC